MMNEPAGMRTISSWAGSLMRSAASFSPSGVHSCFSSPTSSAYPRLPTPSTPAMNRPMTHPLLCTITPPCQLHPLLRGLCRYVLIEIFQRLKIDGQIEQIVRHGAQLHVLIFDNPAAVFLRQLHRKMNIRRDPLVIHIHPLALLRRDF